MKYEIFFAPVVVSGRTVEIPALSRIVGYKYQDHLLHIIYLVEKVSVRSKKK